MRVVEAGEETRAEMLARIRSRGRIAHTPEELYGPEPGPDAPEDLEAFLESLEAGKRAVYLDRDDAR